MTSSIFKAVTKAPIPTYLKVHFTLNVDGIENKSSRMLFYDQELLNYKDLMKDLYTMFPYEELKLTWSLDDEIIECSSDVELASKVSYDHVHYNPLKFIVKAKGRRTSTAPMETIDSEKEKEQVMITPAKRTVKFSRNTRSNIRDVSTI